jgi:3-oxoacyl-[acyl-carrier-protein] synthase III
MAMESIKAKIVSWGQYLPPREQSSADLAPLINRSEHWILSHTGVARRHLADESMDILAARAAREAIGNGPPPDLILNASLTPLQLIPDSSVFIQRALGYEGIPSYTIHATCLSFVVALHTAAAFLQTGAYRRILIVSSETGTPYRNLKEPESASLFGDGAAAVVVERTPSKEESAVLGWKMATWPKGAELTEFRGGGTRRPPINPLTRPEDYLFHMEGPKVFKMARRLVGEVLDELLAETGTRMEDVALVVPHQASGPALDSAVSYGITPDQMMNIIADCGNCIAASIPLALSTALRQNRLKRGDLVLLGGTGAGLSVAFILLRW